MRSFARQFLLAILAGAVPAGLSGNGAVLAEAPAKAAQTAKPGRAQCGVDDGQWTTIYKLPPERSGWLDTLWVTSNGEFFAVGTLIVHCTADQKCDITEVPKEHQFLAAVWGNSPTDVYAVGPRGLITHFDGKGWKVERPRGPKEEARWGHLHQIGDFLPGVVVAGLPGGPDPGDNLVLKRVDGAWQPVTREEWEILYRLSVHWPNDPGPCREQGINEYWPNRQPGPMSAVICQYDRRVHWKEEGRWVPHGNAKHVCHGGRDAAWASQRIGDAWLLSCGREWKKGEKSVIWINRGTSWTRECRSPEVLRFATQDGTLYAVGQRTILRRDPKP
jgi:hypothetical protein